VRSAFFVPFAPSPQRLSFFYSASGAALACYDLNPKMPKASRPRFQLMFDWNPRRRSMELLEQSDYVRQQLRGAGLDRVQTIKEIGPKFGSTIYTIMPGDSWQSIAIKTTGDGTQSNITAIANANGYGLDAPPFRSEYSYSEFCSVYNNGLTQIPVQRFMYLMMRGLYPYMKTPQPNAEDDNSVFSTVVIDVVVAVVVFSVASAIAPVLFPAAFTTTLGGATVAISPLAGAATVAASAALLDVADKG